MAEKRSFDRVRDAFASVGLELQDKDYKNSKTPLPYRCKACGHEDKLRLNDVLAKKVGCRKCGIRKRFNRHQINFPELKAKLLARGIEVLSETCAYSGSRIEVRCTTCQKVWKGKAGELLKTRCRRCMLRDRAKGRTYSTAQVRTALQAMGITLLSDYSKSQSPIQIRFDVCGHEDTSTWNQLQRGDGCPKCAPNARFTDEDYWDAERKHRGKLLAKAKSGSLPSLWQCCLGHVFQRSLLSIRNLGTFCTDCSGSYAEMLCRTIIERLFGQPFRRVRMQGMTSSKGVPLELDIYNEELKIAVEHHGAHHYEPQENWNGGEGLRLQQLNDQTRQNFCEANEILLIEVRELGKRTTVEALREQVRVALAKHGKPIPHGFVEADLTNLPTLNESEVYWREVQEKAYALGLEVLSKVFLGADKPLSVRCSYGHVTPKTPRSILQGRQCDECYMEARKKPLRFSDGRIFESGAAAAKVLNVTKEIVNKAIRQNRRLKGISVERISWDEFRRLSVHHAAGAR